MVVDKLSNWLYQVSSGWVTLSAVLIFILFSALVLPGQSTSSQSQGGEAGSPDLSIYYSPAELYEMAEAYGEQGRVDYIRARFTFDLIWPLVYTFFLTTTISWVIKQTFTSQNPWQRVNLLPVMGMTCDYLENIATSLVIYRYPAKTLVIDWMAGVFTTLKWLLIGVGFLVLIVGIIIAISQWIRNDRRE
jgi:hypothetical protein